MNGKRLRWAAVVGLMMIGAISGNMAISETPAVDEPNSSQGRSAVTAEENRGMGLIIPEEVKEYWRTHRVSFKYNPEQLLASIDWTVNDSPVKNQGSCGSCWAFAAVAVVENIGVQNDLAEQVIVSCVTQSSGCNGGWYGYALEYIRTSGLSPESCYPYTQTTGTCAQKCSNPAFLEKVTQADQYGRWGVPNSSTVNNLKALLQSGPVCVSMLVPEGSSFTGYTSGIYNYSGGAIPSNRGHAILVVGYDDTAQYFKAKNSWGTYWGEGGYFRISYDDVLDDVQFGGYACIASGAYTSGGDLVAPTMEPIVEAQGQNYATAPVFSNFGFDDNLNLDDGWYQMNSCNGTWVTLFSNVNGTSWDNDGWTIPGFGSLPSGSHTIYFRTTDDAGNAGGGCSWKWQFYKTCSSPPVAGFSSTPTSGSAPLTVTFTDLSTGSPTAWSWNFGDGGTATTQNPSHQYTTVGTYTVTLTASNTCGSDGETKTDYITVTQPSQYCDDFNDGSITNWINKLGTWTATAGYMKGSSTTTDARTTSPFGTFGAATINADVRMNTGRTQRTARIIFAYVNANTYRFIEGDDVNNRWRIYERSNGTNTARATVSRTVNTAQWYHVIVNAASDGKVTLTVDGTALGSYKFSAVKSGLVGCGYTKSNSDFDNFCVQAGAGKLVDEPVVTVALPETFILGQNYPNPFNPETNIDYALPVEGLIRLDIYNMLGQLVTTLVDEYQPAGTYSVSWDASGMPTGVYFYRINAGQFTAVKKMVLVK